MFRSTRSETVAVSGPRALLDGLAPDGGLYLPQALPRMDPNLLLSRELSYTGLCFEILRSFFPEFPARDLASSIEAAMGLFPADPAPLVASGKRLFLELFHGPTLAFKDFALSLLGSLLRMAAEVEGSRGERLILVATSGDTGKAALAGFQAQPGFRVLVFFPQEGVSEIQRLQMVTHEAANASVLGVEGNFDDAQGGVKALFSDPVLAAELRRRGIVLGSANSINIGRLIPQIVYYAWACRSALSSGALTAGGLLDFVVPTGNFGDALAASYARRLGLPIGDIIVATNRNRVLSDFFSTGVYDRNRPLFKTESPSMDILAASNVERLLFEACKGDAARVAYLMSSLASKGRFDLLPEEAERMAGFRSGSADDARAAAAIGDSFRSSGYLMDTHSAVAAAVLEDLGGSASRPTVIVSTASPFKFPSAVARALGLESAGSEVETAAALSRLSGLPLPEAVANLPSLPIRHRGVVAPSGMAEALRAYALGSAR